MTNKVRNRTAFELAKSRIQRKIDLQIDPSVYVMAIQNIINERVENVFWDEFEDWTMRDLEDALQFASQDHDQRLLDAYKPEEIKKEDLN
jgi:hypothetical protein